MMALPVINEVPATVTRLSHWAPDIATRTHLQRLKVRVKQ